MNQMQKNVEHEMETGFKFTEAEAVEMHKKWQEGRHVVLQSVAIKEAWP